MIAKVFENTASILRSSILRLLPSWRILAFLVVLNVTLHSLVGLLQYVERLVHFLVLSLDQLHLRGDVFKLILEDFDVVLCGSAVVFNFSLLRFLLCFVHFNFLDFTLQLRNRLSLGVILVSKHLLRLPMRIRQELENLYRKKGRFDLTIKYRY